MHAIRPRSQLSLRLPEEMLDAIDKIAGALERDRTWVLLRALKLYLAHEGADVLRDAESAAALDRGEGIDFDEVLDEVDRIIAQARAG